MNATFQSLRCCAGVATVLALQGCADFGGYDASFGRLDAVPQQLPAAIQVSAPQLYKREALINERKDELVYLQKKLAESETIDIAPELLRDVEAISALTAQLGLSFDAGIRKDTERATQLQDLEHQIATLKLQAQLGQLKRDLELMQAAYASQTAPSAPAGTSTSDTKTPKVEKPDLPALTQLDTLIKSVVQNIDRESKPPRATIGKGSPIDVFRDRQAYRRVLQSEINAVSLDDLHDYEGNSLFRMQFRATVMPGDPRVDKSLGVLRMQINRPRLAKDSPEMKALYARWLDHVTLRLNEGLLSDTKGTNSLLRAMGTARAAFSVISIQVPRVDVANGCPAKMSVDDVMLPEEQGCLVMRIAVTSRGLNADTLVIGIPGGQIRGADLALAQAALTPSAANGRSPLAARFPNFEGFKGLARIPGADAPIFQPKPPVMASGPAPAAATPEAEPSEPCKVGRPSLFKLQKKALMDGFVVTRQKLRFAVGRIADDLAELRPAELNAVYRLIDDAATCASEAEKDLTPVEQATIKTKTDAQEKEVPDAFYSALVGPDEVARGRVAAYAVTPAELAQRVSTVARAGSAVQMAASLSAILPTNGLGVNSALGYSRAATGKVDTLERVPLVVGYAEPGDTTTDGEPKVDGLQPGFGWLLGPKVVIDPAGKALSLEHQLAPYDLTADVVMPGWWPYFNIEYQSEWAPDWLEGKTLATLSSEKTNNRRTMSVPRRHSRGDLDGILALILKNAGEPKVEIASIGRVEPNTISACASEVNVLVQGMNLWRTQAAYLQGLAASGITVLPDMSGVAVRFDMTHLPRRPSQFVEPKLTLLTPNGWASASITIDGSRGENGAGCGNEGLARPKPDDGQPFISAVLPGRLFACDDTQRVIIRGRNLVGPKVQLGGLVATSITDLVAGSELVATFGLIDRHGGSTSNTLPVIVITGSGVAARDVDIERGNCHELARLDAEAAAARRAAEKK